MTTRLRRAVLTVAAALALLPVNCRNREAATTTDDLGRPVAVPARVTRVVALAPNVTEILFAIGAGDRVVGTDDFSNFPRAARALPKVGGMQPNVERIVALRPDLVVASTEGNHPSLAPALAAAKIPLFVVRTDRLSEVAPAMRRLAGLMSARGAEAAVRDLEQAIARERRIRASAPRVLFAVWTDPLYVAGTGTFTDDLFTLTGARNAVVVPGWPQYSLESLLAWPPDIVLYPRGSVTSAQIAALRVRLANLNLKTIPVDDDIFQRPGPRVVNAARTLNAILDEHDDEQRKP